MLRSDAQHRVSKHIKTEHALACNIGTELIIPSTLRDAPFETHASHAPQGDSALLSMTGPFETRASHAPQGDREHALACNIRRRS